MPVTKKCDCCVLLLTFFVLLAGCAPAVQKKPVVSPPPAKVVEKRSVSRLTINQWLYKAETALSADRLMRPGRDNAVYWYARVLGLKPDHPEALQGMQRITERYLELAERALSTGERAKMESYLGRAEQLTASSAQIAAWRKRYLEKQTKGKEFVLDGEDLRKKNERVHQLLSDITRKVISSGSRLLIVARTDGEGRWIYQQMRRSAEGYRLRGNVEKGAAPRVILIDLDE